MTQNPYEPPKARLADTFHRRPGPTGEYDIGLCVADAWNFTWTSFPTWLAVGSVASVLMLFSLMLFLPLLLVVPVLIWGATLFYLNVLAEREHFVDLFAGFSTYASALLAMGGWYLGTLLIGFIGQGIQMLLAASGSELVTGLGVVANMAWTVGVLSRLYFGPFFIVDQAMGPLQGIQASWDATSEQKLRTAGLLVISMAVGMLGVLALLVGALVTMNMFFLMWASAYRQMVPDPAAAPASPPEVAASG